MESNRCGASVTGRSGDDPNAKIPAANILPGVQGLRGPLRASDRRGTASAGARSARRWPAMTPLLVTPSSGNSSTTVHRFAPACTGKTGLDDHGNHQSAIPRLAGGAPQGPGARPYLAHLHLKMNNVWMARETARLAREILGANGIVDDYCIMRHMNNLESVYTYEGTHDIHKLVNRRTHYGDCRIRLNGAIAS